MRLPTYPADANQLPIWRSTVTFHKWTDVDVMSSLKLMNGPFNEKGAFWSNVTGKMLG